MIQNIDCIIARILSGESSSDDYLAFSEWLQEDEKNRNEFCQLKNYWDAEVAYSNHIGREVELKRLQARIQKEESKKRNRRFWVRTAPVAAAITLFLLIGSLLFLKINSPEQPIEYFTYIAGDHSSNFTLADGSKVTLNKNSKLTYTNQFGKKLRDVALTGEAFFEVTKDPSKVFEVKMNNASIKVLGTKFNVKASSKNEIVATLVEGSIRFESGEQKVQLSPSQQLTFNGENRKLQVQNVETESYTAWKDGLVKYKSCPLQEVITSLASRYNTKIIIENSRFKDVVVSGAFSSEQNVEEALNVISRSLPVKWSKEKNIYYIR